MYVQNNVLQSIIRNILKEFKLIKEDYGFLTLFYCSYIYTQCYFITRETVTEVSNRIYDL